MSTLQVVPLGGAGEIGKNCTAVLQGDDMLLVDCGLSFPNEDQFGIDIVVPDFSFVLERKEMLRAVVLTHAHEDHVGALAYLMPHVKCPVFATQFTAALVRSKLEEKRIDAEIDIRVVKPGEMIRVGELEVELVRVTHSIPETCSVAIHTSLGVILFTADFKFDFTPVDGVLTDIGRLADLGREGVLLLVSDSTNADRPGWGPSESTVKEGFRNVFRHAPGRVLITTFASNIHRMQQAIDVAGETGRKVAVAGRRMEQTLDLCSRLGYVRMNREATVRLDDIGKYAEHELVILTTGSQGEPMAALSQISRDEYTRARLHENDTVLYSARPIPGNESAIWRTINRLVEKGADVIYNSLQPVHVSGHAYQEELKMMINLTRPYYLAPVHGEPRHQLLYKHMALNMNYPEHRIFTLSNGTPLLMDEKRAWVEDRVPVGEVLIDQAGGAGVPQQVMSERLTLGHEGVVVVSMAVDTKRGVITTKPKAVAKGFSGSQAVLDEALAMLTSQLADGTKSDLTNKNSLELVIQDTFRKVVGRVARQKPQIVPVVFEVQQ